MGANSKKGLDCDSGLPYRKENFRVDPKTASCMHKSGVLDHQGFQRRNPTQLMSHQANAPRCHKREAAKG